MITHDIGTARRSIADSRKVAVTQDYPSTDSFGIDLRRESADVARSEPRSRRSVPMVRSRRWHLCLAVPRRAVPEGQRATGLRRAPAFWTITLPRSIRVAVPPTADEFITPLEVISLAPVMSRHELLAMTDREIAQTSISPNSTPPR